MFIKMILLKLIYGIKFIIGSQTPAEAWGLSYGKDMHPPKKNAVSTSWGSFCSRAGF